MEYLKRLEDLDYAKIKDRRYDDFLNITIYVMEDNNVIFIQHRINSLGFKFIDYVYNNFEIHSYLKGNKETRDWLSSHYVLTKEDLDSYDLNDARSKKYIESKKKVLRKLMSEFPEVVKEYLEENKIGN